MELESRPCAPTPLLKTLDDMKHNNNRIIQKKGETHESHNRAYNDKLLTEIETLQ